MMSPEQPDTVNPPAPRRVGDDPPATERAARRQVIDTCLRMNALGINQGKAGNASLRWHRGGRDGYLITPSGVSYELLTEDDIVWLALDEDAEQPPEDAGARVFPDSLGPTLVGGWTASSEWRMHRELIRHFDAQAVVHTHSPHATSLACLPRVQRDGIPAFHYMIAAAGGHDIRCAGYALFGTQALADRAIEAMAGRRACLLAHHGQIAIGRSLAAALALAVEVETLARMYWQALQLGEPGLLDQRQMAEVIERFATYGRPAARRSPNT